MTDNNHVMNEQPIHKLGDVSIVLGQKDSGKSVLLEHLLMGMESYVIIDPLDDHYPPGSLDIYSPAELREALKRGQSKCVIKEPFDDEERLTEYLQVAAHYERLHLIIDEANLFMNAHACPDILEKWAQFQVSHSDCAMILAARQAKHIHDAVYSQADNYYVFYYGSHEDSKFQSLPISREHKDQIQELDPFHFLYKRNSARFNKPYVNDPVPLPDHMQ